MNKILNILENCNLCPRKCNVNRLDNKKGYCGATSTIRLGRAMLHNWEEPCISGTNGSGTVFFSHCTLGCVFCQNHEISCNHNGIDVSIEDLSNIFLDLQKQGAHNINLVTPTHYIPQIICAIDLAKDNGLTLPIVYNSSGYENVESIKLLDGYIDIYLPDMKYFDNKYSTKYSHAKDYFKFASDAISEMFKQVGSPVFDDNGIIQKGVVIRHLMLPSLLFDSKKIVDYIFNTFGNDVYISLMNQFTPLNKAMDYKELSKPLNAKHYDCLIDYALSIGVINGFIQEDGTSSKNYVPSFNGEGVINRRQE